MAFKLYDKAFFIYGFEKNKIDNISIKDEIALKNLAKLYFSYSDAEIQKAVKNGEFVEVKHEKT